jgi:hypothetical protein
MPLRPVDSSDSTSTLSHRVGSPGAVDLTEMLAVAEKGTPRCTCPRPGPFNWKVLGRGPGRRRFRVTGVTVASDSESWHLQSLSDD